LGRFRAKIARLGIRIRSGQLAGAGGRSSNRFVGGMTALEEYYKELAEKRLQKLADMCFILGQMEVVLSATVLPWEEAGAKERRALELLMEVKQLVGVS
jgi:hypothetical protein